VFAYEVLGRRAPLATEDLFDFRGSLYGFVAVTLSNYASHARPISPRWDTWALSADDFRRFARPLTELLAPLSAGETKKGGSPEIADALPFHDDAF
jgi:hypothetical protein